MWMLLARASRKKSRCNARGIDAEHGRRLEPVRSATAGSAGANHQCPRLGFGFGKQTDIATANAAITTWRLRKLNAAMANSKLATENDAAEYGKGHEFATRTFKTTWDVAGSLEKYLERGDRRLGDVLRSRQGS